MIIDTTNISTLGLIVTEFKGYQSLPALKKILSERAFASNDIKFEEKTVTVKLFGRFASSAALESAVTGLRSLIESDVEHGFSFVSRNISFQGVVHDGFKATVFRNDVSIVMNIGVLYDTTPV